ncbi:MULTISPECIES: Fic family protein [unclassified Rhizobacter]|uniref:Fic family protein n=1 Tax=unclassified Rhizobacter TaxID=2640088 RepID=UPI0006F4A701|nr:MULTISPECIES: Fic family protein [unclassified Rhizobacter]KQU73452.1 cell filamentation protein Fic [Rhizobacter sp. Root29]KQV98637.1 cell filamentation protein Fic [Rhizobacter sp. Root1238]KRB04890.1 cell filamentation protein Fic [Rhizobacter sp. Root16D2]
MIDWIGYQWLAERHGVAPVQAFRTVSAMAGSRSTVRENGYVREHYPASARPSDTVAGHLAFALKREGVHLEFLARLFAVVEVSALEAWIAAEPTGQYARRACFFYEYLTGRRLAFAGVASGNYVAALDEESCVTARQVVNDPRWRVRDNLPGTRDYCPMVLRTAPVRDAEDYDCAKQLAALEVEFGADLLLRSAVWLTVKESRASFAIEHEEQHVDRVRRFASAMEQRCGQGDGPLSIHALGELQSQILGPRATRYGVRRSPVFVGEVDGFVEVVHYIAPHWKDAPALLSGLRSFAERTAGGSALVRAAVLSFGFVYIHPMSDGNGRISRFLINDTLRRDGAVAAPFILPVSSTIISSVVRRRGYDEVLELFSRPLMRKYAEAWRFGADEVADDGVRSNFRFDAYDDALPAWRYPDLTDHVEYLAEIVQSTLEQEMRKEARHLRSLRRARERVKQVIEGPDADIDRIIRSVRDNGGLVSNKLKKEFPALLQESLAVEVAAAIGTAFDGG